MGNGDITPHLNKAQEDLNPLKALDLFKRISDEDCELLGLRPEFGRPEEYIWQYICVPPVCIRPSVAQDGATNEDDVTIKLTEIIFTNSLLKLGLVKGGKGTTTASSSSSGSSSSSPSPSTSTPSCQASPHSRVRSPVAASASDSRASRVDSAATCPASVSTSPVEPSSDPTPPQDRRGRRSPEGRQNPHLPGARLRAQHRAASSGRP